MQGHTFQLVLLLFIFSDELSSVASSAQMSSPFSPHSLNVFSTLNSTQHQHLHPHEIKHKINLENEAQRIRSIDKMDCWPKPHDFCTIKRVHRPSREIFLQDFVEKQIPVILTGLMDDWPALHNWDFENLGKELLPPSFRNRGGMSWLGRCYVTLF